MKYRKEIDGLRSMAVIPVILFHAGFKTFSGGFVGVDVFFVISGYLITTILLSDLQAGSFSFVDFYERRARRILPALFTVMAACLPLAWIWLMPADMKSFSKSLIAVSLFASNILFWKESGYFSSAAELKPTLHTWSLAVEEQFYLVFPVLLAVAWRFGRGKVTALLAVMALASLAAAQWGAYHNAEATFFLIFTRAWELAIGALVAFHFLRKNGPDGVATSQFGSCLGLALILLSVFAFDERTPFPSLYALVPTLGAALIILYAWPHTLVGRLLGSRAFVGIGLISYSAYLWHQPLFAFARHQASDEPAPSLFLALCLLTFGLAYLSWRFVEQPIRRRDHVNRKQVFRLASYGSVALILIGAAGSLTDGFAFRFSDHNAVIKPLAKITDVYEHYDYKNVVREGTCHSVPETALKENGCIDVRAKNLLLWGDSYAASLYTGLKAVRSARHPDYGITQLTDGNGPPFFTKGLTDDGKPLAQPNEARLAVAKAVQPDIVVLSWYIVGKNAIKTKEASLKALHSTLERIHDVSPKSRIIVIGPFPRWVGTLQKVMVEYAGKHGSAPPQYMRYGLHPKDRDWDAYFKRTVPSQHVEYISAQDILCSEKGCMTWLSDDITDISSVDFGHLTKNASTYFAGRIEAMIFGEAVPQ